MRKSTVANFTFQRPARARAGRAAAERRPQQDEAEMSVFEIM